jgi:membrane protease YdiL (CAAX protease family)
MTTTPNTPTFREILLVYLLSSLLLFSIGTYLQHLHLLSGLIISEMAFVAAPAVIYTLRRGYHLSQTFHITPIRLKTAFLVLITSTAAFFLIGIVAIVQEAIFPRPTDYQEIWEIVLQQFHQLPFILTLFLIAVLPGVCEELFFRGFLLHGIRKTLPDSAAIILVGFLFGIFHLDPYRLLPVSLLGILFGYMVVKTGSIFTGMIAHATNNGIAISLSYAVYTAQQRGISIEQPQPEALLTVQNMLAVLPVISIAGIVLFLGLRALPRIKISDEIRV